MALSAATEWEVRTGGSMDNGGGFVTGSGGTDYSMQVSPQLALTDCYHAAGSTTLTSDTGGFTAAMVGNVIKVVSGTNFTVGWYEIKTYIDANNVTVDRSLGASANTTKDGVVNVGGALAFGHATQDNAFFSAPTAGNTIWINGGGGSTGDTFTIGSNITSATASSYSAPIKVIGYSSTRGDDPTGSARPTLNTSTYSLKAGDYWQFSNVYITGTGSVVVSGGMYNTFRNCAFIAGSLSTYYAINFSSSAYSPIFYGCEFSMPKGISSASAVTISNSTDSAFYGCYFHDCMHKGLYSAGPIIAIGCIFDSCSDYGIQLGASFSVVSNCLFVNCKNGIYTSSALSRCTIVNNLFVDCVTGISWGSTVPSIVVDNNCFYNCTTNKTNVVSTNDVTSDPTITVTVSKGADGASVKATNVFTSASEPFSGVTTNDTLVLFSGTGTGIKLGVYNIVTVNSNSSITLDRDPTNGSSDISSCVFGVVRGTDYTLQTGSSCIDAGFSVDKYNGVTV